MLTIPSPTCTVSAPARILTRMSLVSPRFRPILLT
jgi:hypothetical protein